MFFSSLFLLLFPLSSFLFPPLGWSWSSFYILFSSILSSTCGEGDGGRDAKFYRTSKIGTNMIPSSISSSFRVQINRKLNSHQFCPLNFLNPTYGSKVIKFQKDGKGCIRIQMLYTFKKVCSIIQRCCKELPSSVPVGKFSTSPIGN